MVYSLSIDQLEDPVAEPMSAENPQLSVARDPPRIVIVEDDEDVALVLEYLLEREGYQVLSLADGREALRLVRTSSAPAMMVLDLILPFANGRQVVRDLRQTPGWEEVPVMMISGKSAEDDVVRCLEAGANDYLTKPFRPRELLVRVRRLLQVEPAGAKRAVGAGHDVG